MGVSPNINDVMRVTPLIELGQAELQIRASNRLKDATSKVFCLTVALVVPTACLVGATIAQIVVPTNTHEIVPPDVRRQGPSDYGRFRSSSGIDW